ncbi:hypothetical protein [Christiangramia echinicola]|uniref:hypothetical protein n=1 Tax=Christiangramia echinicola TaxID=279359 RepID=UPI00040E77CF|nr:hypothetical protein [Christiangramia echinicola]
MTIGLFVILSLFSSPNDFDFCTCSESKEITQEDIEDYDLILHGIVQKIETVEHQKLITLNIKTLYKGNLENNIVTISTPADLAMCGLNIGTGTEWLLFAFDENGEYSTNSCTRSGDLDSYIDWIKDRVEKDIVFLENLKK